MEEQEEQLDGDRCGDRGARILGHEAEVTITTGQWSEETSGVWGNYPVSRPLSNTNNTVMWSPGEFNTLVPGESKL